MNQNLLLPKVFKFVLNLDLPKVSKILKTLFSVRSIKTVNLSINELKLIAKFRGIKCYKSMSEDELLSALNAPESLKESEKKMMTQNQK